MSNYNCKYFYAAYAAAPDEIAIFVNEKKRDAWVNCTDEISKIMPPIDSNRIKLTASEIMKNSYNRVQLYNKDRWQGDDLISGMFWLLPREGKNKRKERAKRTEKYFKKLIGVDDETDIEDDRELKEKIKTEIMEELGIKKYTVSVIEKYEREVEIYATDVDSATQKIRNKWECGEITMDPDVDFYEVEIIAK